MHKQNMIFKEFKAQTIKKLQKAIQEKKVDEKVLPILDRINANNACVTTSSCAGRIVIIQLPKVGDKKHALFLGRWHRTVQFSDINNAIINFKKGQLWFITQSPIFHVAVKTLDDADKLLKLGVSAGFKHSGLKTGTNNIIVELCSTERMDVPIGKDDQLFVSKEYLLLLIDFANKLMKRSQQKLNRLEKNLREMNKKIEK